MSDSPFYVTLLSSHDAREFPDNSAARFKARLPSPLPDKTEEWEVGLTGLFLPPQEKVAAKKAPFETPMDGFDEDLVMFNVHGMVSDPGSTDPSTMTSQLATLTVKDIRNFTPSSTGVEFMKKISDALMQGLEKNVPVGKTFVERGKLQRNILRWEGDTLLLDNSETILDKNKVPYFYLDATLALRMGWLKRMKDNSLQLGMNLLREIRQPKEKYPNPRDDYIIWSWGITFDYYHPWVVKLDQLYLCNVYNWRFVRLNEAYAALVTPPKHVDEGVEEKTVFVYSDVAKSSLVGGSMTDLLCVAPYKDEAQGWEPRHVEFHPLRALSIVIVEVNLAWPSGDLVAFPKDSVSHLRLMFRRRHGHNAAGAIE